MPVDYPRKLAEAMEQVASGYDMSHGITAKSTRKDRVDHFAAALASEGVVDPKTFKKLVLEAEIRGITRYAWWRDSVQYVGSGVYTLHDALAPLRSTGESDV